MGSATSSIVFFDLETTGPNIGRDSIIQIGAVCGDVTFNQYVCVPQLKHVRFNESLKFDCDNPYVAVANFIKFIKLLKSKRVILVSHNCVKFNGPMFEIFIKKYKGNELWNYVIGFADSYLVMEKYQRIPCNRWPHGKGYSFSTLVREFLDTDITSNALQNAILLQKLLKKIKITNNEIKSNIYRRIS